MNSSFFHLIYISQIQQTTFPDYLSTYTFAFPPSDIPRTASSTSVTKLLAPTLISNIFPHLQVDYMGTDEGGIVNRQCKPIREPSTGQLSVSPSLRCVRVYGILCAHQINDYMTLKFSSVVTLCLPQHQSSILHKIIIFLNPFGKLMASKSTLEDSLSKYTFPRNSSISSTATYSLFKGTITQTGVPVTIKILKQPHLQLLRYLKKMKDVKSDYVVKMYEVIQEGGSLAIVQELVTYGSLKKALLYCSRMEEGDAAWIAKIMLTGHVDLLRADCNFFGNQDDIEFTDSGLKLSWNNGTPFNLVNPFPTLINKLFARPDLSSSLLPFPQSKLINELVKISKQNASQISMHPQLKQKVKFAKRKGKGWMGLRQNKNKNEYFDEMGYLAVSNDYGFIRVKVYEEGAISPNLLQLNKTKSTFTKLLEIYNQDGKTILISDYSNDGNLQSYIKRLKGAGVTLKQQQIEFFFYSMFDPIKMVQESTLKSVNMLHIRNIYIENGIPKIGEPVPINPKLVEILSDRADVPDFYHPAFKKDPNSHSPSYDTYSLGVLLYKLMYTEYPIFPNNKVHIPTTPSYNKRLKTSLEIFLNEGGSLTDLEKKVEVSDAVVKQVQENKEKLMINTKENKKVNKVQMKMAQQEDGNESASKVSEPQQDEKEEVEEEQDDGEQSWIQTLGSKLKLDSPQADKQKHAFLTSLEESPYRKCRLWTKSLFSITLLIFIFCYSFFANSVALIADQNVLQPIILTVGSSSYTIVTTNYNTFMTTFSGTNQTLSNLNSMNCLIDGTNGVIYSNLIKNTSPSWLGYCIGSLMALLVIMAIRVISGHVQDQVRSLYNKQNGKGHFNVTNYIIFSLFWATLLAGHFFTFNFIYYQQSQPCVGYSALHQYGSTDAFFNQTGSFSLLFTAVFAAQMALCFVYLGLLACNQKIPYNKILNPISIFGIGLLIFVLIIRFGAIFHSQYYPSLSSSNSIINSYFTTGDIVGIIGVIPQLYLLIDFVLALLIDWIFWRFVQKSHSMLSNEGSVLNIDDNV